MQFHPRGCRLGTLMAVKWDLLQETENCRLKVLKIITRSRQVTKIIEHTG